MPSCRLVSIIVVALLGAGLASVATAQVTVYNNFVGPDHDGWDYNWGLGWTVAGVNVPNQYGVEQAMLFYPSASGVVTDIWVAMWYVPLDPQSDVVYLRLTRNPSGQPPTPADVLEEWTITSFQSWSQWNPPQHLTGSGTSYLEQGASYWLWAAGGDTTWCGWCMNKNPSLLCPHTLRREGENWLPIGNETASAFRVDVWPHHTGDLNCDGVVNFGDIDPFVLALGGYEAYHAVYPDCDWLSADCNHDGAVNFGDIDPFVALLGA